MQREDWIINTSLELFGEIHSFLEPKFDVLYKSRIPKSFKCSLNPRSKEIEAQIRGTALEE